MCRHPSGRQLEAKELISLESLLLAGQKKSPKIYTIAVHPLQPHIVAVGANAGEQRHHLLTQYRLWLPVVCTSVQKAAVQIKSKVSQVQYED